MYAWESLKMNNNYANMRHQIMIHRGNMMWIINSDPYESYEVFAKRVNFIAKNMQDDGDIESVIMQSRLWINNLLSGAQY